MALNLVHPPFIVNRLNSNALLERSLNSTLTAKTSDTISSATNIAYVRKKQLSQAQVVPAMKSVSWKEKISTRQILADLHPNSTRYMSFRSYTAGASKDQVESENFQVFISFRGETRTRFTAHLYNGLTLAGYRTFIDELMRRGENIDKELIEAIRNSEASVVVISPRYASSKSCLNELVEILRCKRCFGHKVLPVFYLVDPDDVRNQTAEFGVAFDGLVKSLKDAKDCKRVNRWKKALKEIADMTGLVHCQDEYETHLIDKIVAEVGKQLSAAPQHVPSFVVGWHAFFYTWIQINAAPSIASYIIVECAGIVAAFKYLFRRLNEILMIIRLGIAISICLHSVKRTEKLRNDRPSKQC